MEHSIYWQAYCDVWEYHKKYIGSLKDDDEFWHGLVEEGRKISKKYNSSRFVCNLIANELAEFEEMYKNNC